MVCQLFTPRLSLASRSYTSVPMTVVERCCGDCRGCPCPVSAQLCVASHRIPLDQAVRVAVANGRKGQFADDAACDRHYRATRPLPMSPVRTLTRWWRKADSNRRSLPVNELVSQAGMRM